MLPGSAGDSPEGKDKGEEQQSSEGRSPEGMNNKHAPRRMPALVRRLSHRFSVKQHGIGE
ncbi:uncharacterized protein RMCFA_4704 [Mycolicibacterium fortuitum subsp. acetamidolyticum]|uniref:Uncharacterized protein n=1 Tax=Mycolicibacterium fortuitum subsp. acetamidolyticum TaxID=144550 RepID=A0A100WUB6_MYCFO|nr:uncharacterized protein RMCFA_4704 [Mycolicibacterium fortuitum subsp. acetamidolyticum]